MTDTTRREVLGWLAGLGVAAAVPLLSPSRAAASEPLPVTALRGVTLVDTTGAPPRRDAIIVLADNKILAVGHCDMPLPPGVRVIDLPGKFVIPGLWDMHVHGAYSDRVTLPMCLANGVVGLREMWGFPPIYELRDRIERGEVFGPKLVVGSTIIDGAHPTFPGPLVVTDPDEGRRAVRDWAAQGAEFIKVYSYLDPVVLHAIADECQRVRIPFAGHNSCHVPLGDASDLGQRTFEHMYGLPLATSNRERELREAIARTPLNPADSFAWFKQWLEFERQAALSHNRAKAVALAKRLRRNNSWLSPTISAMRVYSSPPDRFVNDPRMKYIPPFIKSLWDDTLSKWAPVAPQEVRDQAAFLRHRLEQVAEMHAHGVGVVVGTDTGNPYTFAGFSVHDELELLVEAGLSPLSALQAATRNPAQLLGEPAGTLRPGQRADLVVLHGNPFADIRNTRRIHSVLTRGRVLDEVERARMLADAEKAAQEPPPFPAAAQVCC